MIRQFTYRIGIVAFTILGISAGTNAQTLNAYIKAAEKAMEDRDAFSAFSYFEIANDITDGERIDLKAKFADAAREYNAYAIADSLYRQVLAHEENNDYPLTSFHLASVQQVLGKYDSAVANYQIYLTEHQDEDPYYTALAQKEIESCRWALDNVRVSDDSTTIERLGAEVNTPYSEFAALQFGDTLFYTSLSHLKEEDPDAPPKLPYSKVFSSDDGAQGLPLDHQLNDSIFHTGHLTFDREGKRAYYTLCTYEGFGQIRCDLYYRELTSDTIWGDPQKLPAPINQDSATSTQPDIAYDDALGKDVLYFVSDREGGSGGLDIWYSVINDANSFTAPQPLADLNTQYDEITPFYHESTNTLYFSSTGRLGFGGYDIYKSEKNDQNWANPENLGSDINSSLDDAFFSLSEDESEGHLSSNRIGSLYLEEENEACCYDIYKMTAVPVKVNLIAQTFNKLTGAPLDEVTLYIEQRNGDVVSVTKTTGSTNELVFPLKRNKNYTVTAEKEGYAPETIQFSTYGITASEDITKKFFLDPARIVLKVETYDARQRQPLPNVTLDVSSSQTGFAEQKTNPQSHITYFDIQPDNDYLVAATRKGYRRATADVSQAETRSQDTVVKILYLELGNLEDFLPLAIYFDNDQPEPKSNRTNSTKRYLETYEPYYAKKSRFQRRYSRGLADAAKSGAEAEVDQFFEESLRKSKEEFESFLNILNQYLDEGLTFEIFLKGYASPIASDAYNYRLGQRRISTIQNEFAAFRGGVLKQYFNSGNLAVTEKSFGEETAPPGVSDDRGNLRGSVYSPEASTERRVEIIEIIDNVPQQ